MDIAAVRILLITKPSVTLTIRLLVHTIKNESKNCAIKFSMLKQASRVKHKPKLLVDKVHS